MLDAYVPLKAYVMRDWTTTVSQFHFVGRDLYNTERFYNARNARIASAVLAIAIPSVRLSVRHTPVLCQNDGT